MRNFLCIGTNIDVMPLLLALHRQPALWNAPGQTLRTTHPASPHQQVDDIWLRFQDVAAYETTGEAARIVDAHESLWYPAIHALPEARSHIFGLMARVEGERLGRVLLTRLKPGCRIPPHVDGGTHAAYYERFMVSVACPPDALIRAEDEVCHMPAGTAWWFQNGVEHEVWNDASHEDRLTLIVDIHCHTWQGKDTA